MRDSKPTLNHPGLKLGLLVITFLLAGCPGTTAQPAPEAARQPAPAPDAAVSVAVERDRPPDVCALRRWALDTGRRAVAHLPRRLETLRVLQSGNVTVDQSIYAMKLRSNPSAGINHRWDSKRARFTRLSLGPGGAQLEIVAKNADDIAELKIRLDLSMNEPSWILERVTRLRKEVRGRLRHPTGVLKTSQRPKVEAPPTQPAAPAATAACPRGARAPKPSEVKTPGLQWKPVPSLAVGPWTRSGMQARIKGGLTELRELYIKGPLPKGFTGLQVSLEGKFAVLTLYWHEATQGAKASAANAGPEQRSPGADLGILPDLAPPPFSMPFSRRRVSDGRPGGWDLRAVKWMQPSEQKQLVEHLDLLERADRLRQQQYALQVASAQNKVLVKLMNCMRVMLSTAPGRDNAPSTNPRRISGVTVELRKDAIMIKVALPGKEQATRVEQDLRKSKSCGVLKEIQVQTTPQAGPALELEVRARLTPPKIDIKKHKMPVSGSLSIPKDSATADQKFDFKERIRLQHPTVLAFAHRLREKIHNSGRYIKPSASLALYLRSIYVQSELSGAALLSFRTHPDKASAGPLRQRVLDLETGGTLPLVMQLLFDVQRYRPVSMPSRWTWQKQKGERGGKLQVRLLKISLKRLKHR